MTTGCYFCQGHGDIVPRKFKVGHRNSSWKSEHNDQATFDLPYSCPGVLLRCSSVFSVIWIVAYLSLKINFLPKEIMFCKKKWFPAKWNPFRQKEINSWLKKIFPVYWNDSLSNEIITSCQRKSIPVKVNSFLSREIISHQRESFPSNRNHFESKETI